MRHPLTLAILFTACCLVACGEETGTGTTKEACLVKSPEGSLYMCEELTNKSYDPEECQDLTTDFQGSVASIVAECPTENVLASCNDAWDKYTWAGYVYSEEAAWLCEK